MGELIASVLFDQMRGKPSPKKSKLVYAEGTMDPCRWLSTKKLRDSIKAANRSKRRSNKQSRDLRFKSRLKAELTPCFRRFVEFMGFEADPFEYTSAPVLYKRPEQYVYELCIGSEPTISFPDALEAAHTCFSLQGNGYPFASVKRREV